MFFTQPPFYLESIIYSGCKESQFTACHLGKLLLVCASPRVFLTSPKNFFDKQHWLQFFCNLNFLKNFTCPLSKLRTGFTILALLQNPLALGYWTWFFLHAVYYPHPSINAVPVSTGYQICHPLCAKYIDIKVKSFLKSFSQEEKKQPSIQDIIELFLCSLLVLNHIRDQKLDAVTRHVWIF